MTSRTSWTFWTAWTLGPVLLVLAWAAPAHAQITPRTPRPDWGLFGSGVANTEQRLVLNANFGGGYEDDLTKNPPPTAPGVQPAYTGPFGTGGASLNYSVDREGLRGGVTFGAYGRNYRDMDDPFIGTYSLSGNVGWDVSKSGTLGGSVWAGQYLQNLAPAYSPGAGVPGVPTMPGVPGVYATGSTYRSFGASANYSHAITSKISGYGNYSYYVNDAWNSVPGTGNYDSSYLGAGVSYAIGKGFSARAGYGATISGFGSGDIDYRGRTIDAGINYNQSLSLTRRSTLGFSTGVSGVRDFAGTTHYYFVGQVNYNYEIGRSWTAGVNASRGTDFFQTLGQPTVVDSVTGNIGGLIGRRVDVSFGGGWYRGTYAGATSQTYESTSGSANVQYALSRMFALSANYYYYRYDYAPGVILPPGYSQTLERQSIRGMLNVWLPLYTKARRP